MPQEKVRFYSESTGMVVTVNPGKRVQNESGQTIVIGHKVVRFSPVGNTKFGTVETDDEEAIAFLETCGDVFDAQEFNRRSVPAEKRVEIAERKLEEANRLIAKLEAQKAAAGQAPKPPQSAR